ncbi:MAG: hypothetical protein Q9180_003461 [Flavoplaca navasiana]
MLSAHTEESHSKKLLVRDVFDISGADCLNNVPIVVRNGVTFTVADKGRTEVTDHLAIERVKSQKPTNREQTESQLLFGGRPGGLFVDEYEPEKRTLNEESEQNVDKRAKVPRGSNGGRIPRWKAFDEAELDKRVKVLSFSNSGPISYWKTYDDAEFGEP